MVKSKTVYVCNDCGAEHTQWQGQCAACKAWNSLTKVQLGVSSSPAANANFRREVTPEKHQMLKIFRT